MIIIQPIVFLWYGNTAKHYKSFSRFCYPNINDYNKSNILENDSQYSDVMSNNSSDLFL